MANVKSLHLQLLKTRWKWKANVRKHGHNMDLIQWTTESEIALLLQVVIISGINHSFGKCVDE